MRKQCIWLVCKMHSKRRDQCTPYRERHRNIVVHRYTPEKYSIRAERVDDQVESCNVCEVWRVQLQRHQDT